MPDNTVCCLRCDSNHVVKNGFIHNGNQNFKCKSCSRQFVLNPKNKVIGQGTKDLIDKLLLENLPLAGIARVTGVSERWLQIYVNTLYTSVPKEVEVWPKKRGCVAKNGNVADLLFTSKLVVQTVVLQKLVVSQKQVNGKVGKLKSRTLLSNVCSISIQMATLPA